MVRTKSTSSLLEDGGGESRKRSRFFPLTPTQPTPTQPCEAMDRIDVHTSPLADSSSPPGGLDRTMIMGEMMATEAQPTKSSEIVKAPPRRSVRQRYSNSSSASSATTMSTLSSFSSSSSTSIGRISEAAELHDRHPMHEPVGPPLVEEEGALKKRFPIDTGTYRVTRGRKAG
uniref:Uncharacterized protein n=1 Tax=Ciona savignyi TaxID=51511 RepID=H2ZIS0_CIOSA